MSVRPVSSLLIRTTHLRLQRFSPPSVLTPLQKGQTSPTRVREERILAPVCCVALVVVRMVVAMLLGTLFSCGEWKRWWVTQGVRPVHFAGGKWKSGVLHGSWERERGTVKPQALCRLFSFRLSIMGFLCHPLCPKSYLYGWYATEAGTICSSQL